MPLNFSIFLVHNYLAGGISSADYLKTIGWNEKDKWGFEIKIEKTKAEIEKLKNLKRVCFTRKSFGDIY